MNIFYRLGLLSLCFFLFQNCGSFEKAEVDNFYSYNEPPDFYYDLKLLRVELDQNQRQRYTFDLAMSYAHDPDQSITYQVLFSTLDISGVCRGQDGTADDDTKHVRLECLIPVEDRLFLQLTLLGPRDEEVVRQYSF